MLARQLAVARAPQSRSVGELRARRLERVGRAGVLLERRLEAGGEPIAGGCKSLAAERPGDRPGLTLRPGGSDEFVGQRTCVIDAPKPAARVDQLRRRRQVRIGETQRFDQTLLALEVLDRPLGFAE